VPVFLQKGSCRPLSKAGIGQHAALDQHEIHIDCPTPAVHLHQLECEPKSLISHGDAAQHRGVQGVLGCLQGASGRAGQCMFLPCRAVYI